MLNSMSHGAGVLLIFALLGLVLAGVFLFRALGRRVTSDSGHLRHRITVMRAIGALIVLAVLVPTLLAFRRPLRAVGAAFPAVVEPRPGAPFDRVQLLIAMGDLEGIETPRLLETRVVPAAQSVIEGRVDAEDAGYRVEYSVTPDGLKVERTDVFRGGFLGTHTFQGTGSGIQALPGSGVDGGADFAALTPILPLDPPTLALRATSPVREALRLYMRPLRIGEQLRERDATALEPALATLTPQGRAERGRAEKSPIVLVLAGGSVWANFLLLIGCAMLLDPRRLPWTSFFGALTALILAQLFLMGLQWSRAQTALRDAGPAARRSAMVAIASDWTRRDSAARVLADAYDQAVDSDARAAVAEAALFASSVEMRSTPAFAALRDRIARDETPAVRTVWDAYDALDRPGGSPDGS